MKQGWHAVPKNTQTRFVGIRYHIHYTSLRLLFLIINIIHVCTSDSVWILIQHSCMCPIYNVYAWLLKKQAQGCIVDVIRFPYKSCLHIFWHCHPYFILQLLHYNHRKVNHYWGYNHDSCSPKLRPFCCISTSVFVNTKRRNFFLIIAIGIALNLVQLMIFCCFKCW